MLYAFWQEPGRLTQKLPVFMNGIGGDPASTHLFLLHRDQTRVSFQNSQFRRDDRSACDVTLLRLIGSNGASEPGTRNGSRCV